MAFNSAAEAFKLKGNSSFQDGDYATAEMLYTKAISQDPLNPAYFTNRALTRLRLQKFAGVIEDSERAIELLPTSLKAYTYLGQAHLELATPDAAFRASKRAYELALAQRSPSVASIAQSCLDAKKLAWEHSERRRVARESALLAQTTELIVSQAAVKAAEVTDKDDAAVVLEEGEAARRELESVFGRAEATRLQRREVPEWLIDSITFGIMFDPVITKHGHSYDRATLLDHLKRSPTDPLTREPLTVNDLRPNLALKKACEAFLEENGWAVDW
ncbi:hypothetical protein EDC01DRAFT_155752 [Geopyxis carbonaria]|nr:hypothetical protein EDC01DRAFT_155752 [Geopyxis carbonaria]